MAVIVDANLVDGDTVTTVDPTTLQYFDISGNPASIDQINPESESPISNPLTGELLRYLDGVVVALSSGGQEGTLTAIDEALPTATPTLQLTDKAETLVFTFEQSDGTQLVVRAAFTAGEGPTMQQVLDGYTLDDLLDITTRLNNEPFDGTPPPPEEEDKDPVEENPFVGTEDADEVPGSDGIDIFWARGGDDTLNGGAGNDVFGGGDGNDVIDLGSGRNIGWGGSGNDSVTGGDDADVIGGGAGNDSIVGNGGNDLLFGGSGDDTISGGAGNDLVYNGAGSDIVSGGNGADTLYGGSGDDRLEGGSGADVFAFIDGNGTDTISDFEDGLDQIAIVNGAATFADLDITAQGNNTLVSFGSVALVLEDIAPGALSADDFVFS